MSMEKDDVRLEATTNEEQDIEAACTPDRRTAMQSQR